LRNLIFFESLATKKTGEKKRIHHRVTESTEKKQELRKTENDFQLIFHKLDFLCVLCGEFFSPLMLKTLFFDELMR